MKATTQDAAQGGLNAEDWASIRVAHKKSRHAAYRIDGDGYQARNSEQRWKVSFDGRGLSVLPDAGAWTWGLELERYGFAGNEQVVTNPALMSAAGERVSYEWSEAIEEWYVNDARGLEHGFTIAERPVPGEQGKANPLTFAFTVRGPLKPKVDEDGRGVRFLDERGKIVLTYRGLWVVDATGCELKANFKLVGNRVLLSIDEHGARYPLTIDPIVEQQAYLKASNTSSGDAFGVFGYSVSISGDTVIVGAEGEDSNATGVNGDQNNNLKSRSGAAYVFVRTGTTWSQQAYLKASNTGAGDRFGTSVSVSGDTAVVGATLEDSNAIGVNGDESDNSSRNSGAAYIFVRNGTNWSQQAYLKASNTDEHDVFGRSVSVSADTVVVGADGQAEKAGAAYVFVRSGTSWSPQAYLKGSNTRLGDLFGRSVSVSDNMVVVGAPWEASKATGVDGDQNDNSLPKAGAAYVFARNGTSWSQQAYLKASNTGYGDEFGYSVAAWGNMVVVGSPFEDSEGTYNNGAAYLFVRSGTTWSQQAYLKASNSNFHDLFGSSVSTWDDTVVVGAEDEASNATGVNGNQNDNSAVQSGAAYMFVRSGTTWSQQAYLKASNTNGGDFFGHSVSVSGDTVVIGSPGEDSNANGVNSDQSNNSANNAGAAYVFATPPPFTYCTGKTTSAGCVPFVSTIGAPSASSSTFLVRSSDHLENQAGLLIYSTKKGSLDFHGGKLCVKAPFRRLTSLIKATDGLACTGCAGNCRMFSRNFNQVIQSGSDPALTAGQQVYVQVHQHDPNDPVGFGDNLSDALSFVIGP